MADAPEPFSWRVVPAADVDAVAAMASYFAELDERFPAGFDPGDGTDDAELAALSAPRGGFVLVDGPTGVAGCGGVRRHDAVTAEIKRMWIHPDARGCGLGKALLARLEEFVVELGYAHVVLDTNGSLDAAIAMYGRAGYRRIERYNDNPYAELFFAKSLR